MAGLYARDYLILTQDEIEQRKSIDKQGRNVQGAPFGRKNMFHKYPKAIRHHMSLFPNNYLDIVDLKNNDELEKQCDGFEKLLGNVNITELDVKRYIQKNKYFHIPASTFKRFNFGHHEAVLFKEFQLGTSYKADYLLAGRASGGWQFIWIEYENPYGNVTLGDGNPGEVIRKGLNQIDDWKQFIESNYSTVAAEFEKHTDKALPREFTRYDSTRMHYVVVAGRRTNYTETTRSHQRRFLLERNITLIHYDNLLEDARTLIGAQTY